MAMIFLVQHNRNLLFLALLPLNSFVSLSLLHNFLWSDGLYKDHTLEFYLKDSLSNDVSFYILNKILLRLVLVPPFSYFPLAHLLVSLMYSKDLF